MTDEVGVLERSFLLEAQKCACSEEYHNLLVKWIGKILNELDNSLIAKAIDSRCVDDTKDVISNKALQLTAFSLDPIGTIFNFLRDKVVCHPLFDDSVKTILESDLNVWKDELEDTPIDVDKYVLIKDYNAKIKNMLDDLNGYWEFALKELTYQAIKDGAMPQGHIHEMFVGRDKQRKKVIAHYKKGFDVE